jgi:hypothetical protein
MQVGRNLAPDFGGVLKSIRASGLNRAKDHWDLRNQNFNVRRHMLKV